jgi:hypothetical protein
MKGLVAVILAFVLLGVSLAAYSSLLSQRSVEGFVATDIVKPTAMVLQPIDGSAPTPRTLIPQDHGEIMLGWTITEDIYSTYGGEMELSVTNNNTEPRTFHVYGYGITWNNNEVFHRDCNVSIAAGQTKSAGILIFGAPSTPGSASYHIQLDLAVSNLKGNAWYDWGELEQSDVNQATIKELAEKGDYTSRSNPIEYYDRLNSLVSFDDVKKIATGIKAQFPGGYSVMQIAAAYQWMKDNIDYQVDGSVDHWNSANETMALRVGDCDDQAVLMASIIGALGGTARINIIDEHMFPTVFVATNATQLGEVQRSLASFYGLDPTAFKMSYLTDQYGYWLVIDTVGFPYAGGLPAKSSPTDDGQWAPDSTYLDTIDMTGKPGSGGFLGMF